MQPLTGRTQPGLARLRNIFKEGVTSVDVAQNIVVARTMPGLASAACSALDGMDIPGMVGSLAGDDTGILIMRDNGAAQKFSSESPQAAHLTPGSMKEGRNTPCFPCCTLKISPSSNRRISALTAD